MYSVKRFFPKRLGINIKLMLATFALLLGALVSMAWSSYRSSTSIVVNNQRALMFNLVDHTERALRAAQEQLNTLLLSVSENQQLWSLPDPAVEDVLDTYATYNTNIQNLYIIRNNGDIVGVPRPYVRALGKYVVPTLRKHFDDQLVGVVSWTEPYLSPISHWTVAVGMRVRSEDGTSPGIVVVDAPLYVLITELLPKLSSEDGSSLLVLTEHNTPVMVDFDNPLLGYSARANELGLSPRVLSDIVENAAGTIGLTEIAGERFSLLTGATTPNGWRPILLYSDRNVTASTRAVAKTSLGLLVVIGLVSLALAWFVARYFARPLENLAAEMARVQRGRLHGIKAEDRDDEIGDLIRAFDRMMARIRQLVHDLQVSETRKKEAEIRTLQAQIKPHFLYNTLNAIGHSAAMGRTEDVYAMIQSLVQVLSFTFGRSGGKVTVANEIEFLEHYVRLLRIRYGRAFQVEYDVAPDVGNFEILKLTLQPLVENAVFHGLAGRPEGAVLKIRAHRNGDQLTLQVIDNGPGISSERLRELEDMAPDGGATNMGLQNVRERLQLHFGEAASLAIDGSAGLDGEGSGTTITVTLPFQPLPEENAAISELDDEG